MLKPTVPPPAGRRLSLGVGRREEEAYVDTFGYGGRCFVFLVAGIHRNIYSIMRRSCHASRLLMQLPGAHFSPGLSAGASHPINARDPAAATGESVFRPRALHRIDQSALVHCGVRYLAWVLAMAPNKFLQGDVPAFGGAAPEARRWT